MPDQEEIKAPETTEEKPKQEAPKAKQRTPDQELQSSLHRREAQATKRAEAAEARATEAEKTLQIIRDQFSVDQDSETRAKNLAKAEADLERRNTLAAAALKEATAAKLSVKYGIPENDLMEYDTAAEMVAAAKDFQNEQLRKENEDLKKQLGERSTPKGEKPAKKEEEGAEPAKVDSGEASGSKKPYKDMSSQEFEKLHQRNMAQASAKRRTG